MVADRPFVSDLVPILAAWTTRAQGRPARVVDGDLLGRDRALARPRARPRDRRRVLLRRRRADQRLHRRVPGPEPGPRARRRRGALVRVRPGLQRAAREGRAQARAGASRRPSSGCCCSASAALTALFILLAPLHHAAVRLPGGDDDLAVDALARSSSRSSSLLGVSGIVVGILNSYEQFTVPALTPVAWNLAIIAGLVIGVPQARRPTTASSTSTPARSSSGRSSRCCCRCRGCAAATAGCGSRSTGATRRVKQVFELMVPGDARPRADQLQRRHRHVLRVAAASTRTLAPTAIDTAFRIYMLPQGMFSVAVATVLFPTLSRLAARGDMDGFRDTVSRGLRQIAFLLVPASVDLRRARRADRPARSTSAASSRPTRRRSSPARSPRSRSASPSTG